MAERTYIVVKVTAMVISLVCIVGNALVCHVIVRLNTMKTSINYIILNLAILDAISGFLTINFVILTDNRGVLGEPVLQLAYNQSIILADALCRIEWCYWIVSTVSPTLLTLMAYERYKAIVHPFSRLNSALTKGHIKLILALAWILGLGYFIFDMVMATYDSESGTCKYKNYSWYNFKIHSTVYMATQYLIPSTAMFIFYLRVICALRKQDNAFGTQAAAERARRKTRKKVMWIIIVVTLTFYICCGIPQTLFILSIFDSTLIVEPHLVFGILYIMVAFNSAFNPFVYFIFIQSFRDGFKRAFMSRQNNSSTNLRIGRDNQFISLEDMIVSEHKRSQPQLLGFVHPTNH